MPRRVGVAEGSELLVVAADVDETEDDVDEGDAEPPPVGQPEITTTVASQRTPHRLTAIPRSPGPMGTWC